MEKSRPLEILAAALLAYTLFAAFSLIPLLGVFLASLSPLPLVILYTRSGKLPFLMASAVVAVLLGATFSPPLALFFVATMGILSAITGEGLNRNVAMFSVVFFGAAAVLVSLAFIVGIAMLQQGIDPIEMLRQHVISNLEETVGVYRELKRDPEEIDLLSENIPLITDTFVTLFPAFILIGVGGESLMVYALSAVVLTRLGVASPKMKPFSGWVVPDPVIWGIIAGGGLLLVPLPVVKGVGANILILLLSVYLVQGISIVSFYFAKWRLHPLLRSLGYFLIVSQVFLLFPVLSMGLFDTWADFRKLRKPHSPERES